jgi:hypothetical protein
VPAGQARQEEEPGGENLPAAHSVQRVHIRSHSFPSASEEYFPATHTEHVRAAPPEERDPALQGAQAIADAYLHN